MHKRLYRCRKERMIWGVCGGLAQYFDVDPTIMRFIFVLTIFLGGLGVIAYIVLAIITPLESSPVTQTGETVRENINEMKDTAESIGKDIRTTLSKGDTKEVKEDTPHRVTFILGGIVLIIGIIALISTLTSLNIWAILWPILLIAIGLLILFARRK